MTIEPSRGRAVPPPEVTITLALSVATALGGRREDGWVPSDLVRGALRRLGFDCTTQQVAAWLKRMAAEDAPWVDRRRCPWDHCWEYRATHFGANDVDNKLPGLRITHHWPLRPLEERVLPLSEKELSDA